MNRRLRLIMTPGNTARATRPPAGDALSIPAETARYSASRRQMLAAAALGAGLLPGRAALKQCSGSVTRVALELQERAEPARTWASSYDLASEEVTIEAASSTAGPLEAYETAENPAQEGAVRAAEERAALILLPDASGWQGEGVRSLADRRAAPPQRAPPLSLPLPTPCPCT
jgi:hypothetical protein